jgi:hypothetical protein
MRLGVGTVQARMSVIDVSLKVLKNRFGAPSAEGKRKLPATSVTGAIDYRDCQ